jgi:glycosyltransferase involved in cell wall biosynthesis
VKLEELLVVRGKNGCLSIRQCRGNGTRQGWDSQLELLIAGEGDAGYVAALKALAQEKGIQDNLLWLGWVESSARYALMAEFDLLVLPSQNENFANVVIEALSVGTPVLISEQVGLQDYVVAQQLGWVTPLSVAAVAEGLVQAQAAQAHRAWVRAQGPGIIRRDFAAQAVAERYLEAYEGVMI